MGSPTRTGLVRRAALLVCLTVAWGAVPAAAQDCNSLYAARMAEIGGAPDCQTVLAGVPRCPGGVTANQCASDTFANPPAPAGGTGPFQWKWVMGPLTARCVDGTRPAVWLDKAVDSAGNDLYTNDWLFFTPGEGGPCTGSESRVGCYERYASPLRTRETANGLSSMHPDSALPKEFARFGGILSPRPSPNAAQFNPFMRFNRVYVERCTTGVSSGTEIVNLEYVTPTGGVVGSKLTATTALVHHDGDLLWEAILAMLGTEAGRDLGPGNNAYIAGPDLPPIDEATTVLLAGASDNGKWMILSADRLEARIEALNPLIDVNVGIAIDGHAVPSIQHEMVRLDALANPNMFVAAHANTGGFSLPDDGNPLSSDDFGNSIWQLLPPGNGSYRQADGMGALLDASCEAQHGVYSEYCLDEMHVAFHHLGTPVFFRQDQRDNVYVGSPAQFSVEQSLPLYEFPADDYRDRVFDQFLDYVDNSALAHEPSAAGKGIFSTDIGRRKSHVVFTDDRRSRRDRLTICSGAAIVDTWSVATSLYDWLMTGNDLTLIERATALQLPGQIGPGEHIVRASTCP